MIGSSLLRLVPFKKQDKEESNAEYWQLKYNNAVDARNGLQLLFGVGIIALVILLIAQQDYRPLDTLLMLFVSVLLLSSVVWANYRYIRKLDIWGFTKREDYRFFISSSLLLTLSALSIQTILTSAVASKTIAAAFAFVFIFLSFVSVDFAWHKQRHYLQKQVLSLSSRKIRESSPSLQETQTIYYQIIAPDGFPQETAQVRKSRMYAYSILLILPLLASLIVYVIQ